MIFENNDVNKAANSKLRVVNWIFIIVAQEFMP